MRAYDLIGQVWRHHHQALKGLVVLLVLNVCLFVAISQWLVPQVLDKERTFLQQQAEQRSRMHSQNPGIRSPQQKYVLASQDLSRFNQSIPAYNEFTGLIEELLVLSNDARLNITQISYSSEDSEKSPLLKFSLSFSVVGNYDQIKKFIYSLEQSVRLLALTRISLQGTDENGVRLQLNLETYFNPGEEKES